MNVMHEISALPWRVVEWVARDSDGAVEGGGSQVVDAEGYLISACTTEGANEAEEANLVKIVKAVNAHAKLVEVLKVIRELVEQDRHIPLVLVEMALLEAGEPV